MARSGIALPLSTWERGFVLVAVRVLGERADAFLRARGAHLAQAAAVLVDDGPARLREMARLEQSTPEGIERVHPSWWQRPPSTTRPAVRAWIDRAATAGLVPMPAPPPWTSGTALTSLDALSAEALTALLSSLGRRRVAVAFYEAPRAALAQLCTRVGEPAASQLVAEVRAVRPSHDEVRAAQRALFKLAVDAPDARSLFVSAGARWLAPALAVEGGDLLRRVAQRLPRVYGQALLAEVGAAATEADHRFCHDAVAELAG